MKIHRFFIKETLAPDELVVSDSSVVHQLRDVLKIGIDETVHLFNGTGAEATAQVASYPAHGVIFTISTVEQKPEAWRAVTVYLAIVKHDSFEWAVQKLTEIGVQQIVPVITDRTIKKDVPVVRLGKIIREAAEQSGRTMLPTLGAVTDFATAIAAGGYKIFCDQSPTVFGAGDLAGQSSVSLFIGPEGGFTDNEKKIATEAGALVRSLGPTILRAETAAAVGATLAINL